MTRWIAVYTLFASAWAGAATVNFHGAAGLDYVPGELLVGFRSSSARASAAALHRKTGADVVSTYAAVDAQRVRVPLSKDLRKVADLYARDPSVAYVEPNYIVRALAVPEDPDFNKLWGMERISAPEFWDTATGSTQILVGVIDTGVDFNHSDLADNIWINPGESGLDTNGLDKATNGVDDDGNGKVDDVRGWDFYADDNDPMDENDHGTHVAGTVGAVGNNSNGVAGVNWRVSIVPLRFLGPSGSGTTADAVDAILYAATIPGMRLTCNSWGGGSYSLMLKEAIRTVGDAGQLFVAAAGNDAANNDAYAHYPSSYDNENILSVASIAANGTLSSFSNYGRESVDLAAPGSAIYSTVPGDAYDTFSGTSMATPHVAGAAALLWSTDPGASMTDVRQALLEGAEPNAALDGRVKTGGELDLVLAYE
jgi:subtilisin family serine protease